MKKILIHKIKTILSNKRFLLIGGIVLFLAILFFANTETPNLIKGSVAPAFAPLDTVAYDLKLKQLANIKIIPPPRPKNPYAKIETAVTAKIPVTITQKPNLWPVKTVYPNTGAILPSKRIIAYYGNLYSRKMGALGQWPEDEMLKRLDVEVKKWSLADPETPAIPALHYIAVTAQSAAGKDGKHILRMPDTEIDKVVRMAAKIDAIVILDIQIGFSTLQNELPYLEKYLKMPNVHLGIDPEWSMKTGAKPGDVIGTMDAKEINFTINYLAKIVRENNLTPKVLIIHRFTQNMVTNYQNIKPLPEVQIVMHMDGWGGAAKKRDTYKRVVYKEPVQFAGFKLFYKHDVIEKGTSLMTPNDLLKLSPQPIYIQYQ